jgi:small subunit ribosomal protein S1
MRRQNLLIGEVVTGTVVRQLDWGYHIRTTSGHDGRLYPGELSWTKPRDRSTPHSLPIGTTLQLQVIQVKPRPGGDGQYIQFSVKELFPDPWQVVERTYPVGTRISATVTGFLPYGAYLDLPAGLSILIHNTEVTWKYPNATAEEFFVIGQIIDIIVTESSSTPKRLGGSHKAAIPDPWLDFQAEAPMGTIFDGVVISIASFGAFVRLSNGFVGLIHNSQIADALELSPGLTIKTSIASIDSAARRVSLSVVLGDA